MPSSKGLTRKQMKYYLMALGFIWVFMATAVMLLRYFSIDIFDGYRLESSVYISGGIFFVAGVILVYISDSKVVHKLLR